MAEEVLVRLERAIGLATSRLRQLRTENADLTQAVHELKKELEELQRENKEMALETQRLRRDRLKIRSRVARIRENLTSLEQPYKESGLQGT